MLIKKVNKTLNERESLVDRSLWCLHFNFDSFNYKFSFSFLFSLIFIRLFLLLGLSV